MKPIRVIEGRAVPLDRADVDTDQIMPKQYLKRIERTGFGEFLFAGWREDPAFVLNDPAYAGAPILVTGANFGSGSSREHAPWGLQQYGFEAVIAPSFADIFKGNCAKIGLLTVELPGDACKQLIGAVTEDPGRTVRVDLPAQAVTGPDGTTWSFAVDPFVKSLLLEGLDDIGLTARHADDIAAYEQRRPAWLPTTR